ncbi:aryldialkylphosphatase [Actinomadura alba]|uniref:Aryldialkylphosphatase n=1 Tax=Actinomadura alba TaxID=406431 RepID=A0ABR7M127_9ACTN|nr:aryldialkylphosphatase [Actinomadura alba]
MGRVRTVLGDIEAAALGRTDYHEHLFQVTPLLPGDELDDEDLSGEEARLLRAAGIDAMVEATPTGLGRDPAATARISARTGLGVVLTTGAHREAHYPSGHWLTALGPARLAERFTADLLDGAPAMDGPGESAPARSPKGEPVRAGLLKAGTGYWSISPFERDVLDAVAAAHRATGAPVMVHLEHGSAAVEVLELLASGGVPADRVVLAHLDRNPDPGAHAELAATGAYLGYDGMARTRQWPDSVLLDCLLRVAALGGADRVLLGGDVARRTRYVAYGGMPGLAYLPARFVPRLEREGGAELVRTVLVDNPARALAWSP